MLSSIIVNLISIFTKKRFKKITKIISSLNFIILILTVVLFYVVISQLTEVGVGSVMGSGDLDVNLPGETQSTIVNCNWGLGISFYLAVFILALSAILQIFKRKIINFLERKNL
jgi:hypothetical protein